MIIEHDQHIMPGPLASGVAVIEAIEQATGEKHPYLLIEFAHPNGTDTHLLDLDHARGFQARLNGALERMEEVATKPKLITPPGAGGLLIPDHVVREGRDDNGETSDDQQGD